MVGGGIVGLSAALTLASWSVPVVLCEKGSLGGEQSTVARGWIRKQGMDPRLLPLMLESERLWRSRARTHGSAFGFRQTGSTRLRTDPAAAASDRAWLARTALHETGSRPLSAAEWGVWPGMPVDRRICGALFTATDCQVDPGRALPALVRQAGEAGARLFERTAVRGLLQRSGRIEGVLTEHGTVACQGVIVAAGVWSRRLLAGTGLPPLPQIGVRSGQLQTGPAPPTLPGIVEWDGIAIGGRADGGWTVTGTGVEVVELDVSMLRNLSVLLPAWWRRRRQPGWRWLPCTPAGAGWQGRRRSHPASLYEAQRTLIRPPDAVRLDRVWALAQQRFPALQGVAVESLQGGLLDTTADGLPLIDAVRSPAGLVLATGLGPDGLALGPGVGLLAAQLVTGRRPVVDPQPFSLSRFYPGRRRRRKIRTG